MSKLTAEEYAILQPIVSGVAISLGRKYPVDRGDIEQECWVWVLAHTKQVRELLDLEDEKEQARLLFYRLQLGAKGYCEQEKAAALGYEPEDVHFYSTKELGTLLELVFDEEAWQGPPTSDSDGSSNSQDPAVGGNWLATLSDVSRAFAGLALADQELLRWYYQNKRSQVEIAARLEVAQSTVSKRIEAALKRLHENLGGERPDPFVEYTGSRRRMSNAHANAIIRNQESA